MFTWFDVYKAGISSGGGGGGDYVLVVKFSGGDYVLVVKFMGGILSTYTKMSRGGFVRGIMSVSLFWSVLFVVCLFTLESYIVNNMDPDQTAPEGAV